MGDKGVYRNTYYNFRVFRGPDINWSDRLHGITLRLYSPADLLLTDPQGRRVGLDPLTGTRYREIPRAGYMEEGGTEDPETGEVVIPPVNELDVREALDGRYELTVTGTGIGTYTLLIFAEDRTGNDQEGSPEFQGIPTAPGVIHRYTFEYSSTPGTPFQLSGGFDGHGQRPTDVNKFLTYANPSAARTPLPAGQASFPLLVFYGPTTIPARFKATLNGADITAQFTPTPGGHQLVPLPLVKGSNVLLLSVDGTTASGRVATDTDRLVFLVP